VQEAPWLFLIILLPLLGAFLNGFFGKRLGKGFVRLIGVAAPVAAFVLCLAVLFGMVYADFGGPRQSVVAYKGTPAQIRAVHTRLTSLSGPRTAGPMGAWEFKLEDQDKTLHVLRIRNASPDDLLLKSAQASNSSLEFGLASEVATPRSFSVHLGEWIHVGRFKVDFTFVIDRLAIVLLLVITGVGSLIHVYSTGYMGSEDPGTFARFFTYLNLFVAAMLVLVMGNNLLLMFVGWEGVGLCSYLLIGFGYTDPDKAACGTKAFVVNRIGDVGFVLGMLTLLMFTAQASGGGDLDLVFSKLNSLALTNSGQGAMLGVACILLVVGATGKSAQIPLHLWLPDAMAGPTPVSALIHAATMVTAGIYLVARLSDVFASAVFMGIPVLGIVALIGVTTAFFAGMAALGQDDIKRVLAYSTISQLGYMFVGVGTAAMGSAVFHLVTHAFFKALLFLGAGAVIHATHTQSMKEMGGLRKSMPFTFVTMLVGAAALAGFPLFSGFFSKDLILFEVLNRYTLPGADRAAWGAIYAIGVLTGLVTAVYSTRLVCMTFFGEYRGRGAPHEAPTSMTLPLMVLAVLAVLGGLLGLPALQHVLPHEVLPGEWLGSMFEGAKFPMAENSHDLELRGLAIGSLAAIAGVVLGYLGWGRSKPSEIAWETATEGPLYKCRDVLANAWYYDTVVNKRLVQPGIKYLAKLLWRNVDQTAIDEGLVDGTGRVAVQLSLFARMFQNGKVSRYAGYFVFGVVLLTVFVTVFSIPRVLQFMQELTQSLGS
jgi:NADH-quinone oxidoreductase subunit L